VTVPGDYLTALARRGAAVFVARTHPQAILLTGSVTEGESDHYSDLDVILYYDELPSDEALAAAQAELGGADRVVFGPRTEMDLGEQYLVDGVACQFAHTTVAAWEDEMASVLERLDVASPIQKALGGMRDAIPLHGDEHITRWQDRVRAYPDTLARAMVEHYSAFYPIWYLAPRLATRDATIWLVDSFVESSRNLLGVLAGLNHVYYTPFQFKRMRRFVEQLALAPDHLADRLESLFVDDHVAAAYDLEALVGETVALAQRRMPEANIPVERLRLGQRAQPWQSSG
jgi:hypothetical protein